MGGYEIGDRGRKDVNRDRCSQKLNEGGFRQYILIKKIYFYCTYEKYTETRNRKINDNLKKRHFLFNSTWAIWIIVCGVQQYRGTSSLPPGGPFGSSSAVSNSTEALPL